MILVDTSVWVDHLRRRNDQLASLLEGGEVVTHPFVIGELALGNLGRRDEILGLLSRLPAAPVAEHDEVMGIVRRHGLANSGVGWIDVHLLASARLARARLWTFDRRLALAAQR